MASNSRVSKAFSAMRDLGIPGEKVKPVLKELLKVFDKNWEPIEAENYRALVDAYFEYEEDKRNDKRKGAIEQGGFERSSKRPHLEEQKNRASSTEGNSSQMLAREEGEVPSITSSQQMMGSSQTFLRVCNESTSQLPQTGLHDKGKDPVLSDGTPGDRKQNSETTSLAVYSQQPKLNPGSAPLRRVSVPSCPRNIDLIKPGTEQTSNELQLFAEPISVVYPGNSVKSLASPGVDMNNAGTSCKKNLDIALSPLGEVKLSLTFNSCLVKPNFQTPKLDAVLKSVEDRYLRSNEIVSRQFSMVQLLEDLCKSYLELGTASDRSVIVKNSPEVVTNVSDAHRIAGTKKRASKIGNSGRDSNRRGPNCVGNLNSRNLAGVQQRPFFCNEKRLFHNLSDITKGTENVKISLVDEIGNEDLPVFTYIPHNIIYQDGNIDIKLARIADDDCCSNCSGDCLSSSLPCACARETGGEFAYTPQGMLKEEFLRACMSKQDFVFCQDCPLERSKNGLISEPCKGHLVRKFIKECWRKCGCDMQCGNRVVQRGITRKLEVFLSHEGKGWALRTLEDLPKGTFVCEYVGEILTNMELYNRNMQSGGTERHTYPVTLDADWGSEGVLEDEEALCLDATIYGNVARFINHRCSDANLIDIPVEVETPDRHYYHLAFFTCREVSASEELTWDYGIDFNDHDHPVKAFRCCCGSASCRDKKQKGVTGGLRKLCTD